MNRIGEIPISILTGFLGSGKTTVLNRLVRHPGMAKALVIINEFGEIGLDHELVESAVDDIVLLQSGCLCCTVRSDLLETLQEMLIRRERAQVAEFNRVVIETTGLADPAPILQALMADPVVTAGLCLDGVITTVDAAAGEASLDRHMEAVKQVAVADRILLTKGDIVGESRCLQTERRLRALNPGAPILRSVDGEVDPDLLFDVGFYNPSGKVIEPQRWLDEKRFVRSGDAGDHHHADHAAGGSGNHPSHDVNRHDEHIHATCLVFDKPIPGQALDNWLSSLFRLRGPDLLRFKAIVNVAELPGPLVLHGVQHVIHPPKALKRWPSDDRRTRMVFITYDMDEFSLRSSFRQFVEERAG